MAAYVSFRIALCIILGAVWYVIDRKFGVRWYKWWHDMTHEQPLPPEAARGFIFNKPTKVKAFAALVLSSFISVLSVYFADEKPLIELVLWFVAIPATMIGFLLGPRIFPVWQKRDAIFDSVDKWERGEIDLTDKLKTKTAEIGASVKEEFSEAVEKSRAKKPTEPTPPPPAPETSRADAEEMMNKFIRDRQG